MKKFRVGDKVRLKSEVIKKYEDDVNGPNKGGWVYEAPYIFRRDRIFTITYIDNQGDVKLDNNIGGIWLSENIELYEWVDPELFKM